MAEVVRAVDLWPAKQRSPPTFPFPLSKKTKDLGISITNDRAPLGAYVPSMETSECLYGPSVTSSPCGRAGLKELSRTAVLNANYVRHRLQGHYDLPYQTPSLHEVIFSDKIQGRSGVKTLEIGKRLMDYGFHPPTIYFPLIVPGALMIEPTESESKAELDAFVDAMIAISREANNDPEKFSSAPETTKTARLDETRAARYPILRWTREG